MKKVKVHNDNPHKEVWEEQFKGEKVTIKRGHPIEMEFYEAHEFKGQFYPPKKNADDQQDPKTFKMIRLEVIKDDAGPTVEDGEVFQCNACKKVFLTDDKLTKHAEKEHAHLMVVDPELDKEIATKKRRKTGASETV